MLHESLQKHRNLHMFVEHDASVLLEILNVSRKSSQVLVSVAEMNTFKYCTNFRLTA